MRPHTQFSPIVILIFMAFLAAAVPSAAESTDCNNPVVIATDGKPVNSSSFTSNATYWFAIVGQAGHSYSVEFSADNENSVISTKIQFFNFAIFGPHDLTACRGNSSVTAVQTVGYSPALAKDGYGTAKRASFIASTSGEYFIAIANFAANSGAYSYRVIDTTLYNPRWSTWGGFDTQWGLMNLSNMTIQGTFSIYTANDQLIGAVQISIPAGSLWCRSSGTTDLNLPRNSNGFVTFAYTGPPGAILADSYMLNGNASVVVPSKFEPRGIP